MMNFRGEPLDIPQTVDMSAHHPVIECALRLTHQVDLRKLRAAVAQTAQVIPEILTAYNWAHHRFEDHGGTSDQVVQEYASFHDPSRATLDVTKGPQLEIQVIHHGDYDRLRVYLSRILTDGPGLATYLYLLSAAYEGREITNWVNKRGVQGILANLRRQGGRLAKPEPVTVERIPSVRGGIHHHNGETVIPQATYAKILQRAADEQLRPHTVLLAAYAMALWTLTGQATMTLPYQVDLRQFNPENHAQNQVQVANLTVNMMIPVTIHGDDPFDTIVRQVNQQVTTHAHQGGYLAPIMALSHLGWPLPPSFGRRLVHRTWPWPTVTCQQYGDLNQQRLRFDGMPVAHAYVVGAYQEMPQFDLSMSTFAETCTLAFRMIGSEQDYQLGLKVMTNVSSQLALWAAGITQKS